MTVPSTAMGKNESSSLDARPLSRQHVNSNCPLVQLHNSEVALFNDCPFNPFHKIYHSSPGCGLVMTCSLSNAQWPYTRSSWSRWRKTRSRIAAPTLLEVDGGFHLSLPSPPQNQNVHFATEVLKHQPIFSLSLTVHGG